MMPTTPVRFNALAAKKKAGPKDRQNLIALPVFLAWC
jgi:hypothetical protein